MDKKVFDEYYKAPNEEDRIRWDRYPEEVLYTFTRIKTWSDDVEISDQAAATLTLAAVTNHWLERISVEMERANANAANATEGA